MIGGTSSLERGSGGGSGAPELSTAVLAVKKVPKRVALSVGEQAIEPSGWKSEGKLELQKFLEKFLAKDQKALSRDRDRLSTFLL